METKRLIIFDLEESFPLHFEWLQRLQKDEFRWLEAGELQFGGARAFYRGARAFFVGC